MDTTLEQRSDHALMLAVRAGELDALGELFERHQGPLFGFLVKLIGNRSGAEDVAQTVFQRMLKYRHTYRDDGSFTAWMYHLGRGELRVEGVDTTEVTVRSGAKAVASKPR